MGTRDRDQAEQERERQELEQQEQEQRMSPPRGIAIDGEDEISNNPVIINK